MCMPYANPILFYIRDGASLNFGICRGSWNQFPMDTEG